MGVRWRIHRKNFGVKETYMGRWIMIVYCVFVKMK